MKRRICVDLPGMRLQAPKERAFARIVGDDFTASHEECKAKCRRHVGCKQALFSPARGCHLSEQASTQVMAYTDIFNSSYCGVAEEQGALMDLLHQAYNKEPCAQRQVKCSWKNDDCSTTACCNNVDCAWDFSECVGYKCYTRDDGFAGCRKDGPEPGWLGSIVGGPREPREQPKVRLGCEMQGASLFCFSVVMWHLPAAEDNFDSEAALANNWPRKGHGILQCDENALYEGLEAPKEDFTGISNVESFIHAWEQVRLDGRYQNHDWVVKVDVDAVFFADRLKQHLGKLKTPQHAEVYLWNSKDHYNFKGAIEVLTSEAVDAYFQHAAECNGWQSHDGPEDIYMKMCLDSIGVDHQTDLEILHEPSATDRKCANGWAAVFHPHRSVADWNKCHDEAVAARA
jgi:hypothetical protein